MHVKFDQYCCWCYYPTVIATTTYIVITILNCSNSPATASGHCYSTLLRQPHCRYYKDNCYHTVPAGDCDSYIYYLKNLSQYWCSARLVTVGDHFRIIRKWCFACFLVKKKNWHKIRKVYWIWRVATVRSINHNVGTLKELSCQM